MSQRPHVCFDRILPRELMRPQATVTRGGRLRGVAPLGKTWMNGSTLRVRFMGGSAAQRAKVKEQAGWWQAVANLKFEFNDAPDAEIRIGFDASTAAHEFGHAIGLAHEHQNPAGGIQWNEAVVIREMAGSPNFWDEQTTRHNILARYRADQVNSTKFDPASIMLYFFPAAWTTNGVGTEANEVLSAMDKQFIAGAKMYPGKGPTVDTATPPAHGGRHRQVGRGRPVPLHREDHRQAHRRYARPHRYGDEALRPRQPHRSDRRGRRLRPGQQCPHRGRPPARRLLGAGAPLQPGQRSGGLHDQGAPGLVSRTGSPRTFQRIADPAPATGGAGAAGAARRGGRASICPLVFSFSDRRGLRVTVPAWGTRQ